MSGLEMTIDTSDLKPLAGALEHVEADLAKRTSGRLREAALSCSTALLAELRSAAGQAPTPQAKLVAQAMRARQGERVGIEIGGSLAVGSRGTPAGVLVWGSEHGGSNFDAARGGSYWIAPTVSRFKAGPAERTYQAAVESILKDNGL